MKWKKDEQVSKSRHKIKFENNEKVKSMDFLMRFQQLFAVHVVCFLVEETRVI